MGAIEQAMLNAARIAVAEANKPLEKKIEMLYSTEAKRMMSKSEAAQYMGVSLYTFNLMTKSQGFPKSELGFWARGWIDEWMSKR